MHAFSHGALPHVNSLFDHDDTTTSDSDSDRMSKKCKHDEDCSSAVMTMKMVAV